MRWNQSNNDKIKLTEKPNRINMRETSQERITSTPRFRKASVDLYAYETVIIDLCIKCSFAELISNETQLTFLWAEKSLAIAPLLNEKEVTELLENATPKTRKVSLVGCQ